MTDLLSKFDAIIAERAGLVATGIKDPFGIVMQEVRSATEAVIDGRETILVGTYNYMGMTFDPDVQRAGVEAIARYGAGSTGSRVLNGTFQGHTEVEAALREFYGMSHAIVFSTGYQANLGVVSTLAGRGDFVILDADSHASIYDGCAMGNADVVRFRHNDPEDLAKRLRRLPKEAGKLVILEGVYSMLGDRGRLTEMMPAAREHGAMVMVDEAHAMGFYGPNGRGVYEELGLEDQVDFVVGTFSKSVGTVGGFCVSNHPKTEVLRLVCRPYVFTASLPPAVVAMAETSIRKLMGARAKRERLWENTRALHVGLRARGFDIATPEPESAIIAVLMPDQLTTARMWDALIRAGVYVNMARPPATPTGVYLLRCSVSAEHSSAQIARVLDAFSTAADRCGLGLKAAA
ncbi:MAG: aminotransferase class I/II-fold pyridoxal phosphate-dependent enzyme [Sphingomonadaceae bacterium]|nr:aminotransferase class I/II-fold pyridoxal phosphate-dependent enzyme [Sphingomonadaceae bacterium]